MCRLLSLWRCPAVWLLRSMASQLLALIQQALKLCCLSQPGSLAAAVAAQMEHLKGSTAPAPVRAPLASRKMLQGVPTPAPALLNGPLLARLSKAAGKSTLFLSQTGQIPGLLSVAMLGSCLCMWSQLCTCRQLDPPLQHHSGAPSLVVQPVRAAPASSAAVAWAVIQVTLVAALLTATAPMWPSHGAPTSRSTVQQ